MWKSGPGLLPEPVTRALDLCRSEASDDPDLAALVELERDMLDLAALRGDLPDELAAAYSALATDSDRRRRYLELLAGFHRIEGRRPADVEPEIARLAESLIADPTIRSITTGASAATDDSLTGPTLDQLLPDSAQREVLRRTFSALGVEL